MNNVLMILVLDHVCGVIFVPTNVLHSCVETFAPAVCGSVAQLPPFLYSRGRGLNNRLSGAPPVPHTRI